MRQALKNPEPAVRAQAAQLLVRIGPAESHAAIPTLIELLNGTEISPCLQAAQALGRIGPEAKAAIPSLVELLDDPRVAPVAIPALLQIGPQSVPLILETWRSEESADRPGVIQALGQFGPAAQPAVPKLMAALTSRDQRVRRQAATALEKIGTEAVPALVTALTEGTPDIRPSVTQIFGRMGPIAGAAIPALTRLLHDPDARLRLQAAQALWDVEHAAERIVPTLLEGLRDQNLSQRRFCAQFLRQIGPLAPSAVPALQAALKDPDRAVQVSAAACLCAIPGHVKEALPVLLTALKDPNLRGPAITALGNAGPEAKEALPALASALQEEAQDFYFIGRMGWLLQQIGGPESVDTVLRIFAAAARTTRTMLVEALRKPARPVLRRLPNLSTTPMGCCARKRSRRWASSGRPQPPASPRWSRRYGIKTRRFAERRSWPRV